MDLEALKLFIEVARAGSFAAAARAHDLDPSAISRSVAQLEASLGVRLLQRSTRRMALTEAGEDYLRRVEGASLEIEAAGEAAKAMGAGPRGVLRMTASVAFGQRRIAPLLPAMRQAFPELGLELVLSDSNLDLIAERIDLPIRLGPSLSGDLVGAKLFATRYHVCASLNYLKRNPWLESPADLSRAKCIIVHFACISRHLAVSRRFRRHS